MSTRGKRSTFRLAVALTAAAAVSPAAQRAARAGAARWCLVLGVKSSSIKPETLLEEHGGRKENKQKSSQIFTELMILFALELVFYPGENQVSVVTWVW